jgi:hypothetical protein
MVACSERIPKEAKILTHVFLPPPPRSASTRLAAVFSRQSSTGGSGSGAKMDEDSRRGGPASSPLVSRTSSGTTAAGFGPALYQNSGMPSSPGGPGARGAANQSHLRKTANRLLLDVFNGLASPLRATWQAVAGAPGSRAMRTHDLRNPAADLSLYARHPKLALDPFAATQKRTLSPQQRWLRRLLYSFALVCTIFLLYSHSPLSYFGSDGGSSGGQQDGLLQNTAGERPAPPLGSRPSYRIPFSDSDVEMDASVARNVEAGRSALRLRKRAMPEIPDGRRYMMYMYHSGASITWLESRSQECR